MQSGDAPGVLSVPASMACGIRLRLFAVVGVECRFAARSSGEALHPAGCSGAGPCGPIRPLWLGEAVLTVMFMRCMSIGTALPSAMIRQQKGTVMRVSIAPPILAISRGLRSDWMHACRPDGLGFRSKERFHILIADIALLGPRYKIHDTRASADPTADGARNYAHIGRNDVSRRTENRLR